MASRQDNEQRSVESLARYAPLEPATGIAMPVPFRSEPEPEALDRWLDQACARLGVEMEAVDASAAEIVHLLQGAAPALLRYRHADELYMLLLVGATARAVQLLGPDLRTTNVTVERVREAFCAKAEKQVVAEIEAALQLSPGERSRLYLARALLQNAQLVVLDESFAALDPDTSERCLRCALSRAATLLVIAHP